MTFSNFIGFYTKKTKFATIFSLVQINYKTKKKNSFIYSQISIQRLFWWLNKTPLNRGTRYIGISDIKKNQ